jgi:hypothetical protein
MIAAYAVLSPTSRLRLRLTLFRQIVLGAVAVSFLFFFYFFDLARAKLGVESWLIRQFGFSRAGRIFTQRDAAFIVVFLWVPFAVLLKRLAKPNPLGLRTLWP